LGEDNNGEYWSGFIQDKFYVVAKEMKNKIIRKIFFKVQCSAQNMRQLSSNTFLLRTDLLAVCIYLYMEERKKCATDAV
jgi:hypothetical protein